MKRKMVAVSGLVVSALLGWQESASAYWTPYEASGYGLPQASLYDIITNILDWLLTMIGIVGVIAFAVAGIMYLLSAGDQKRIDTAKNYMQNAIIGVIVAIVGVVVLRAVDTMLNAGALF